MNRRSFLKLSTFAAGAVFLPASGLFAPVRAASGGAPDVAVVKGSPAAAARAAIDLLGGMGRFVRPGQRVVIKPNMSFAQKPDSATNTHPEIVRELLVMCKEAGAARVRVLDHSLQNAEDSLNLSGIRAACDSVEAGLCHHLMNADFYMEEAIGGGVAMRSNAIMRDVLEADVLIAAPVAKSHGGAGVSLSMKGQMGLIMNRYIMHSRYDLHEAIVDLNTRIKPHLAVIDATRVLTTGGPGGPGVVIAPGEVIASADPVAADATAVASYEWYGSRRAPRQINYIRIAHERGLGRMDIENLNTIRASV
jgi:uncharacterized protein (DUF362 family)